MREIMYCRAGEQTGRAAARQVKSSSLPLAVIEGHAIRDICPQAEEAGLAAAMPIRSAKARCPLLLTVPLETVDARPETEQFLRALTERLPYAAIEPDGPDAAFVALALPASPDDIRDVAPVAAVGTSRNAAHAPAESTCQNFTVCDARRLWPEDDAVTDACIA